MVKRRILIGFLVAVCLVVLVFPADTKRFSTRQLSPEHMVLMHIDMDRTALRLAATIRFQTVAFVFLLCEI